MNKRRNNLKKWLVATVSMLGATFLFSSSTSAYGPERSTFTMAEPADYVTFNSITDNPTLGDERNFVRIAEADSGSAYQDEIKLEPGKIYELYIGYHNNAKSSLNQTGAGIARGTKVAVQYPTSVEPGQKGVISAIISAVNADPKEVWDEVYVTSDVDIMLDYDIASAKIYNDWGTNGETLSTAIFSEEGTYIGLNELNGLLPGCAEYSGHILIKFKANTMNARVKKSVSLDGENFFPEVDVKPGDEVTYKVEFTNTGTMELHNVTFHDELPEGLTLVEDSTYLKYSSEPTANKITDLIADNGYNTGLYDPETSATITYKVKISDDQEFCGSLTNKIFVDYDGGEITDGAIVNVKGDSCEEPVYDCDTDPTLPECQEETCITNPDLPECQEIVKTGPLEIVMAIIVIAGIGGGGYYLYRTKRILNKVERSAKGEDLSSQDSASTADSDEGSSQKPDNMVE